MKAVTASALAAALIGLALPATGQAQGVVEDRMGGITEDRPGAGLDRQQLGRAPVGLGSLDQDGDNVISRDEFTAARPGQPRMFDRFDGDQDGRITLDEFLEQRRALQERRFNRLDANGDGAITEEDIAARRGVVFDNLDRNDDGVLSQDELRRPGRGMRRR